MVSLCGIECEKLFLKTRSCGFCLTLCDTIVQYCKYFSAYGTVNNVCAACTMFSPVLPDGNQTICAIATAMLSLDSGAVSV